MWLSGGKGLAIFVSVEKFVGGKWCGYLVKRCGYLVVVVDKVILMSSLLKELDKNFIFSFTFLNSINSRVI